MVVAQAHRCKYVSFCQTNDCKLSTIHTAKVALMILVTYVHVHARVIAHVCISEDNSLPQRDGYHTLAQRGTSMSQRGLDHDIMNQ